jgi:outer membrane murein-binding lipoprotein Lpp
MDEQQKTIGAPVDDISQIKDLMSMTQNNAPLALAIFAVLMLNKVKNNQVKSELETKINDLASRIKKIENKD